jgi:site-specific recombinase XerD
LTLAHLIEAFIHSRTLHVAARTIEWYHYTLGPLAESLGDRPVASISTADIESFLARMSPGRSPRTLQSFYTAIVALCNWAVERGHLAANPTAPIHPPDPHRHRRHIPDTFSDAQVRALLAACQERRDRAILLVLLDCGLRRNELLGLDLEDTDFDDGFLLVHGKGNKDRYVPIGSRALAAVREYLLGHPGHGALFLNRHRRRLEKGGLRSMLSRIKARAGLECRVHPHKFRHTFARCYLAGGGDLETLRAILGHEDIRLTSQVYAHFLRGGLKDKHRRCSPVNHHQWEQCTLEGHLGKS